MYRLAIALFAAVLALPVAAGAQTDDDPVAQAAALSEQATALFRDGNYAEAAILFQEAYNLDPDLILMFNIGRAQQEMGDLPAALLFYRRVLGPGVADELATIAQTRIDAVSSELRAQGYDPDTVTSTEYVPRGSLIITSQPEGAAVFIGGARVGSTPLEQDLVDAGTYAVRLTADGHHPLQASVEVRGGPATIRHFVLEERTTLDEYVPPSPGYISIVAPEDGLEVLIDGAPVGTTPLSLAPLAAGTYVVTVRSDRYRTWTSQITVVAGEEQRVLARMERLDGRDGPARSTQRTVGVGLLAGGGAVAAAGAVLGILALDAASEYRLSPADPDRGEIRDRARGLALGADIAIAVGAATAATGLVLHLTAPRPAGDGFPPEVVLAPSVVRRGIGASLRVRF